MRFIAKFSPIFIFALCISFLGINFYYSSVQFWDTWGKSGVNQKSIYINDTNLSSKTILSSLIDSSIESDVSIERSENRLIDNTLVSIKGVYFTEKSPNLFENTPIISGKSLEPKQLNKNLYLSSKPCLDQNNCVGELFDFMKLNNIRITGLNNLALAGTSLNGEYSIRYNTNSDFENFLKILSKKLQINEKDLTQQLGIKKTSYDSVRTLMLLLFVILFICLLLWVFFISHLSIKKAKEISVNKLLGNSSLSIWINYLLSLLFPLFIVFIAFDIIVVFYISYLSSIFINQLLILECVLLFLLVLATSPILLLIKVYRISDMLKGKKPTKVLYFASFILKQILVILILIVLSTMPFLYQTIEKNLSLTVWNKYSNLAVIKGYVLGNDEQEFISGGKNLNTKLAKLNYHLLNSGGFLTIAKKLNPYEDFSYCNDANTQNNCLDSERTFEYNNKHIANNFSTDYFIADTNYLNKYPLFNLNGDKLTEDDLISLYKGTNKPDRFLLIPKSLTNGKITIDDFRNLIIKSNELSVDVSKHRIAFQINTSANVDENVIVYDDSRSKIFSFSDDTFNYQSFANKNLEHPIIQIVTKDSVYSEELLPFSSGITDPIKFNLDKKNIEEFNIEITPKLNELGLESNDVRFSSIGDIRSSGVKDLQFSMFTLIAVSTVSFVLILYFLSQMSILFVETYLKKIFVQKILGIGVFKRYINLFICETVCAILMFGVVFPLSSSLFKSLNQKGTQIVTINGCLLTQLVVFGVNIIILILCLRYHEKKQINKTIKEV